MLEKGGPREVFGYVGLDVCEVLSARKKVSCCARHTILRGRSGITDVLSMPRGVTTSCPAISGRARSATKILEMNQPTEDEKKDQSQTMTLYLLRRTKLCPLPIQHAPHLPILHQHIMNSIISMRQYRRPVVFRNIRFQPVEQPSQERGG